jgi:RES domain-containing protein
MVYTAGSQALAALELLVHLDRADILPAYLLIPAEIPDALIEKLDPATLPRNWRAEPAPPRVRAIGDRWIASATSVALEVPSAVVPAERNYLLNPAHPDFARTAIGKPHRFELDPRLVK